MNKTLELRIEELENKKTESEIEIPIQLRIILNVITFNMDFIIVRLTISVFKF